MILDLLFASVVAALSAALIGGLVVMSGVLDAPTLKRKAHRAPTPTSGGIAIGGGFAVGLFAATLPFASLWAEAVGPDAVRRVGLVCVAAFLALGIGVRDDLRPLGPITKTGAMIALAAFVVLAIARAERLPWAEGVALLTFGPVFGALGSALWVFTVMNAVNFVDGANGLAMGSTAIGLGGLGAVSIAAGAPHAALLSLAGAGALAGFLIWNFPGGRLFAGDAGSLFAGALAAAASLVAVQDGGVSPLVPPILFFPILADVLLTLAWRVRQKRPDLMNGHNEHLFQVGLRAGLSHTQVALIYWAATAHCALIAFLAAFGPRIDFTLLRGSGAWEPALVATATLAAASPAIALAALAAISIRVSQQVRRYAAARGLDGG